MANLGKHFEIDIKKGLSLDGAIKKGSHYRITVLSDRLVRLEYSKNGSFNDLPTDFAINRTFDLPKFTCEEDDKYLVINTKYFNLQYLKESAFKGPSFAPDANLKIKLNNTDKVWYYDHPEARNYLSSAFSLDDFSGGSKKLFKGLYSTDGFVSIKDNVTFIINEQGVLNYVDDKEYIDMYVFMYKRDFGLCLRDYFTLTGYPTLIPRYALGLWWYRDIIYSENDISKLLDVFKENQIPLSVLLLGEFWHEKDTNNYDARKSGYTFSKSLFPDVKSFIDNLHSNGIRLGINIDPTEGVNSYDEAYSKFQKEFSIDGDKNIPFNALNKMYMISYLEYLIQPLTALDIDFFWIDYKNDIKSLRVLDYYHIRDYRKTEYKRPMLLTRNTQVAAHRNGILYSGETVVSWNTLKYLPFYNANASNVGVSWWSHDIGGFKDGIEDAELYMRYVQFATFNPIFRFSAKRGPYYKREPWLWDYKTENIVKLYTQLRYKLIPYIYTEASVYNRSGLPLVQPIYYNYPEIYDEPYYKSEYFFGRQLFVCPIVSPKDVVMNRVVQRIFLPKGNWYDYKTGKKFVGGKRYVTFYEDEDYPVFVKEGTILPLANTENKINLIDNPEVMDIYVYPGKNGSYNLYEDDGITKMYEQGLYHITSFDFVNEKDDYTLTIKHLEGNLSVLPQYRDFNIIFKNTTNIVTTKATASGTGIEYTVDQIGNDYIVRLTHVDTSKELVIKCTGQNIVVDTMQLLNEDLDSIINDIKIKTSLKEEIAKIAFSDMPIKNKRIEINKLKRKGLNVNYAKMFMKIYDYLGEI